jgi:ligand-binding SRPBCC domain-containing protein
LRVHLLERAQVVRAPLDRVCAFFSEARNLERITPEWLGFEVLTPEPIGMRVGTQIQYRLRLHGVALNWTSRIEVWEKDRAFVDRQLSGPYRLWHHRHEFTAVGEGTLVRDRVPYALPLSSGCGLPDCERCRKRSIWPASLRSWTPSTAPASSAT